MISLKKKIKQKIFDYVKKIKESSEFLKKKISIKPKFGIILGTGLGKLANEISISEEFKYENIPHFPKSTVEGHSGKLILEKFVE